MLEYEICGDEKTVWVNSSSGMCVGRFGTNIDIHKDFEAQQATGQECLDCKELTGDPQSDWQYFVDGMKKHYGITVPEKYKPKGKLCRI